MISKLILVLSHSNFKEDRLFSIVIKIRQHFVALWITLSSILTIRFGSKRPAHLCELPRELLKKAKSAKSE